MSGYMSDEELRAEREENERVERYEYAILHAAAIIRSSSQWLPSREGAVREAKELLEEIRRKD